MRMRKSLLVALLLSVLAMSCRDINYSEKGYKKAVRSGLKMIPEAKQIEELLGDSDHFISYSGSRSVGNNWNTEVYFYGRYVLTMQVPVRMGYEFDEVLEVLDEPKFYLVEVRSIEFYGNDNNPGASFEQGDDYPYPFTAKDWAKVYQAKGDFSVIGIDLKKDQPVKDFEKYVHAKRRDRVKVDENDE